MRIAEHYAELQALVAATPFLAAKILTYDERPPDAAVLMGSVVFADGSRLDFKEFLVGPPPGRIVKYGYHFRRANQMKRWAFGAARRTVRGCRAAGGA